MLETELAAAPEIFESNQRFQKNGLGKMNDDVRLTVS